MEVTETEFLIMGARAVVAEAARAYIHPVFADGVLSVTPQRMLEMAVEQLERLERAETVALRNAAPKEIE